MNSDKNNTNKFLFDLNNFNSPDEEDENIVEEEVYVAPPAPTFSQDELEAAKIMAQSHGRSEGMREERAKREQLISDNLQKITEDFENLFAAELYREKQYEEESIRLALSVIDQLAPSLNERFGNDELKYLIKSVIQSQEGQSEIRIEVHPDFAGEIDQYIESLWDDNDNAPKCKVVANSEIDLGGCNLTWKDGGMARNPQKLARDMKEAIENLLVDSVLFAPQRKNEGKAAHNDVSDVTNPENNAIKESDSTNSPDSLSNQEQNGET